MHRLKGGSQAVQRVPAATALARMSAGWLGPELILLRRRQLLKRGPLPSPHTVSISSQPAQRQSATCLRRAPARSDCRRCHGVWGERESRPLGFSVSNLRAGREERPGHRCPLRGSSQHVLLRWQLGREERLEGGLRGRRGSLWGGRVGRHGRGGQEGRGGRDRRGGAGRRAGGLEDGPIVEKEGALLDEEFNDCLIGAGGRQGVHGAEIWPHQRRPEADGQVIARHQVHAAVVTDPVAGKRERKGP